MSNVDINIIKTLIQKVIMKEKEFLNEKSMTETAKVKEIKNIIENEVTLYDN